MAALVDLPAELLSRIASHLFCFDPASHNTYEDHGFYSLRLSCRGTEARTRYAFARAAFSTIAVTLHATSLQRLQNIASQGQIGRTIKKLVFVKARHQVFDQVIATSESVRQHEYASYGVIELPRDGDDGVYPNDGLTLKRRVHLGLQDVFAKTLSLTPNLQDLVIEPNFVASFWLDSPSRQDQLNEMAQRMYQSAIDEVQNQRAHDIHADEGSEFSPEFDMESVHGDNQDYDDDKYKDSYHIETYVYPDYLLYLVATTAHRQCIQFTTMGSSNPMTSSIRARTFVELVPALQSLQHLEISMAMESITKLVRKDNSGLHDVDGMPIADSFGHALGRLQRLRTLRLSFDDNYWENDRNPMMAESLRAISQQTFGRLANIHIENAYFGGDTLCHFLHNQRSILRELGLHCITLPTIEHWRPIFALLLWEAPELWNLACSRPTPQSEMMVSFEEYTRWRNVFRMRCCGREQVAAELQRALDYFSGTLS